MALQSLDGDFPNHMRMQAAEIVEGADAGERIGKCVVSIERLRPEYLVRIDHCMRYVVVIDSFDRRADGNRQFLRREREVVDRDNVGVLRRYSSERQHCANHRTQNHRDD